MPIPFAELARSAEEHLLRVEPRFEPIIRSHGPCSLAPEPDLFRGSVRAVIAQLISTAAARSIKNKFYAALDNKLTTARVLAMTDDEMRDCGLSGSKRKTIRAIADLFATNRSFNATLSKADDETIRATLLPLPGIGPWTVDMLLIFCLGRPDVWPVGDFAVRMAAKDLFRMRKMPDARRLTKLAKPWQPYRTFAAWYLWQSRTPGKKS